MTRMRRVQTGRRSDPDAAAVVQAVTLMIDICDDGTMTAVIGRLDLTTRRYCFTRMADQLAPSPSKYQLVLAINQVAEEMMVDINNAPW